MSKESATIIAIKNLVHCIFLGFVIISVPFVGPLIRVAVEYFIGEETNPSRSIEDPGRRFIEYTNLDWPAKVVVVSIGDVHRGLHGNGEFHLVVDVDQIMLEQWLKSPPPWGGVDWRKGPVPHEIADRCFFFGKSDATYQKALGQPQILYSSHDYTDNYIPWNNGILLAIDPILGRVYLSRWDY